MSEDKTQVYDDNLIEEYEYDGITEYDNPCPAWLMYIFYFTALLSVFFVGYHYGSNSKNAILEDYANKLQNALTQTPTQKPEVAVDESELLALLQNPEALAEGEEIFNDQCTLCHGPNGQGMIGPNLIDNYWLHGKGKISDIALSIRAGIPEKGMAAWADRVSEEQIRYTAAYIKSLQGTTADNPKEPEGELVE